MVTGPRAYLGLEHILLGDTIQPINTCYSANCFFCPTANHRYFSVSVHMVLAHSFQPPYIISPKIYLSNTLIMDIQMVFNFLPLQTMPQLNLSVQAPMHIGNENVSCSMTS